MNTKPFRWTKRNNAIRNCLLDGKTKDDVMNIVRESTQDMRPSERAMTAADWSHAIDTVAERMAAAKKD